MHKLENAAFRPVLKRTSCPSWQDPQAERRQYIKQMKEEMMDVYMYVDPCRCIYTYMNMDVCRCMSMYVDRCMSRYVKKYRSMHVDAYRCMQIHVCRCVDKCVSMQNYMC